MCVVSVCSEWTWNSFSLIRIVIACTNNYSFFVFIFPVFEFGEWFSWISNFRHHSELTLTAVDPTEFHVQIWEKKCRFSQWNSQTSLFLQCRQACSVWLQFPQCQCDQDWMDSVVYAKNDGIQFGAILTAYKTHEQNNGKLCNVHMIWWMLLPSPASTRNSVELVSVQRLKSKNNNNNDFKQTIELSERSKWSFVYAATYYIRRCTPMSAVCINALPFSPVAVQMQKESTNNIAAARIVYFVILRSFGSVFLFVVVTCVCVTIRPFSLSENGTAWGSIFAEMK